MQKHETFVLNLISPVFRNHLSMNFDLNSETESISRLSKFVLFVMFVLVYESYFHHISFVRE